MAISTQSHVVLYTTAHLELARIIASGLERSFPHAAKPRLLRTQEAGTDEWSVASDLGPNAEVDTHLRMQIHAHSIADGWYAGYLAGCKAPARAS